MSHYYPIFVNLKDQRVLVVGGGAVACRKVQTLVEHEALVRIVSPRIVPELEGLIDGKRCIWLTKEYAPEDLQDVIMVFACTEKDTVNFQITTDAQALHIPINVVDDPEKCSFIVPSIMERGDLSIAVSTGGSSPIVARQIREELEKMYGEEMAEYLALLGRWRGKIKEGLVAEKRRAFWDKVTDGEIRRMIGSKRLNEAEEVMEQCFLSLLD